MKQNILLLLIIFFASAAHAEEIDPKFFKDWLTLSGLLQSKGITPSAPSWSSIIPMCLSLKEANNETEYNRCLYGKVMDEYQWQSDKKYCTAKADSAYNNYLQEQRQVSSAIVVDSDGKKTIVQQDSRNIAPSKNSKDRDFFYSDCMITEMNWKNPDLWTTGHRETKLP